MDPYDTFAFNPRTPPPAIKLLFLAFQMFGMCGTALMLLTAILARFYRYPTWFSLIFSFLVSTVSYCLLFLAGHWNNPSPPFALCLTQAALIYAVPPYAAGTICALVIQVYLNLRNLITDRRDPRMKRWTITMVVVPHVIPVAMTIGCLVVGTMNPSTVQRKQGNPFCNFELRIPSRIASVSVACIMMTQLAIQVVIFMKLRSSWKIIRQHRIDPALIIRVSVLSVLGALSASLGIIFIALDGGNCYLYILLATIPAQVTLIFGTQADMLKPWMFWQWEWRRALFSFKR